MILTYILNATFRIFNGIAPLHSCIIKSSFSFSWFAIVGYFNIETD